MLGQDLSHQLLLTRDYQSLIFLGVAPTFSNKFRDIGILEEKLIEPCDLRQHLQIGVVLQLEDLPRTLRGSALVAKMIPEFAVPGITSNHVFWIGLKQVLQRELALAGVKISGGLGRDLKKRVPSTPGHIILNLRNQGRDKIESLMDA